MSKSIHVRDAELIRAVEEGAEYLIIGQRRFLLVEVGDNAAEEPYDVSDPDEIALIRKVLDNARPLLSGDEAQAYVQARLRKHGRRLDGTRRGWTASLAMTHGASATAGSRWRRN